MVGTTTNEGIETQEAVNAAAFRRLIEEGFSRGDLEVVDQVISPRCVEHQDGMGQGPAGVRGAVSFLHALAPDIQVSVEDLLACGDTVWARLRGRGTHSGELLGGPTGRGFDITVMDWCRFQNGQVVEHWGVPDRFAQMQQLGLLQIAPAPEGAQR